jgi:uncharacterized protein
MIERFYDAVSGGFFDSESKKESLGVLSSPRKPFQDSPTPAGNSMAVIALLRLHSYTDEPQYRAKAEQTLEMLSGVAGQYGLFAATYGLAATHFAYPHSQLVVIGEDKTADDLYSCAVGIPTVTTSAIRLRFEQVTASNLPPSLAATIPYLPAIEQRKTVAVICSGNTCKAPVSTVEQLNGVLNGLDSAA